MTPTQEEIKALCERLRSNAKGLSKTGVLGQRPAILDAADALEALTEQVAELRAEYLNASKDASEMAGKLNAAEKRLAEVEAIEAELHDTVRYLLAHRDRLESALRGAHDAFDTIKECAENCVHAPGQMTNYSTAKYGLSLVETALSGSDLVKTAREETKDAR